MRPQLPLGSPAYLLVVSSGLAPTQLSRQVGAAYPWRHRTGTSDGTGMATRLRQVQSFYTYAMYIQQPKHTTPKKANGDRGPIQGDDPTQTNQMGSCIFHITA